MVGSNVGAESEKEVGWATRHWASEDGKECAGPAGRGEKLEKEKEKLARSARIWPNPDF